MNTTQTLTALIPIPLAVVLVLMLHRAGLHDRILHAYVMLLTVLAVARGVATFAWPDMPAGLPAAASIPLVVIGIVLVLRARRRAQAAQGRHPGRGN